MLKSLPFGLTFLSDLAKTGGAEAPFAHIWFCHLQRIYPIVTRQRQQTLTAG